MANTIYDKEMLIKTFGKDYAYMKKCEKREGL